MNIIKKIVESILLEQQDGDSKKKQKNKINAKGAFGSGSWSKDIGLMQSRAQTDPEGLIKDLGIKNASGDSDIKKCASVLKQAISKNSTMKEAFNQPTNITIKKDNKKIKAYSIKPNSEDLTYRLAAKYICLTLLAAQNSGILQLENGISFASRHSVDVPTFY